jgi:hypothetical protein
MLEFQATRASRRASFDHQKARIQHEKMVGFSTDHLPGSGQSTDQHRGHGYGHQRSGTGWICGIVGFFGYNTWQDKYLKLSAPVDYIFRKGKKVLGKNVT